jgi:protocatechuate 3,4-dioxygenase beta subunit
MEASVPARVSRQVLRGFAGLLLAAGLGAPLLAAPALAAQDFPVSGHVVDAATGQPVARATVALTPIDAGQATPAAQVAPSPGQSRGLGFRSRRFGAQTPQTPALAAVSTGADGGFLFPAVPPGRYRLSAARRGYAVAFFDEHAGFFAAVIVGPGASATGLRFPLRPNATIEGAVLDSSGDPVEMASLTLFRRVDDGTGAIRQVRSTFVQQGDSSYAFTDLTPGTYYLSASGRPWYAEAPPPSGANAGAPDPLDVVYPVTFYDGAASSSAAQPIVLKAGDDAHADMTLSAVPAVHLQLPSGDTSGSFMMPQLSQSAFSGSVSVPIWQTSYEAGPPGRPPVRTITVPPGTYTLHAEGADRTLDTADGSTLPNLTEQNPPVQVSGRVAMADGSPLPAGAQLELNPVSENVQGAVSAVSFFSGGASGRRGFGGFDGFARLRERSVDSTLQADGSFHANAVMPGQYRVSLSDAAHGDLVVTDAAAGGGQISGHFVLQVGLQPVTLAATAVRGDSSIAGVVSDAHGAPEAGVMVLLAPADGTLPTLYRQEESNSDGSFSIPDIPAGAYRVMAIRDGWDLAWRSPAVLSPYLAAGVAALVPANGMLALKQPVPAQDR